MKPALGREMSRYLGGAHTADGIRTLLRTVEVLAFGIAVLSSVGVWAGSAWLASEWVQSTSLTGDEVAETFKIMGLVVSLRFVESLYLGCVVGLQRQVLENVLGSVLHTIRAVGAVGVLLWMSRTIQAYFVWQAVISVISVAAYAIAVYWVLPQARRPVRFSLSALREIWRFAAGMLAVSILTLLLTQIDKVLLSRLLDLETFGYYTLAGAVAAALFKFVMPIATAFYPRFVELRTRGMEAALSSAYHACSQLVSVVLGSAALVLIVFAEPILLVWTQDPDLSNTVAPLLRVLAAGTLLNGLMWSPYHIQLAYGWTMLTIQINAVAVTIMIPALFWVVPRYGALGAAYAWLALNAGYVLFQVHLMHRRILQSEKWRWYLQDLILPLSVVGLTLIAARLLTPAASGTLAEVAVALASSAAALGLAAMASPSLRPNILQYVRRASAPSEAPPASFGGGGDQVSPRLHADRPTTRFPN
jgi:O-antigen/teichoic acid export membrane protein